MFKLFLQAEEKLQTKIDFLRDNLEISYRLRQNKVQGQSSSKPFILFQSSFWKIEVLGEWALMAETAEHLILP